MTRRFFLALAAAFPFLWRRWGSERSEQDVSTYACIGRGTGDVLTLKKVPRGWKVIEFEEAKVGDVVRIIDPSNIKADRKLADLPTLGTYRVTTPPTPYQMPNGQMTWGMAGDRLS